MNTNEANSGTSKITRRSALTYMGVLAAAGAGLSLAAACSNDAANGSNGPSSSAPADGSSHTANSSSTSASTLTNSAAPAVQAAIAQYDWLLGSAQIGEAVAIAKGWYQEAGLDVTLTPGGPNVQSLSQVVGGRPLVGQMSSSDSIIVACAEGNPIKAIGAGFQQHPYAYFSKSKTQLKTAEDFVGLTVGVQPGDGQQLLEAALRKNNIDLDSVEIVTVGSDFSPLLADRVDVFTGWVTNTGPISALGDDYNVLRLWDLGVHLYANVYFATEQTIERNGEQLAAFMEATKRGWLYARDNSADALKALVAIAENVDMNAESDSLPLVMDFSFGSLASAENWGAMDASTWGSQIQVMESVNWFGDKAAPAVDDVFDTSILG